MNENEIFAKEPEVVTESGKICSIIGLVLAIANHILGALLMTM